MRRTSSAWALIALAAWALLAIVAWRSEDLAAAGSAPPLSESGYQMEPGRYVVIGVLYWDTATGALLLCSEGASDCPPGALVTPEPSETPGTVLTPTPPPTNTPRPSATPVQTATPGATIEPTPTQEMKCWGTVTASRLNVRDAPGGTVLGQVSQGDALALEGVRAADDGSKWYLIYWLPDVTGFVSAQYVEADPGAACDHLARGPGVGWTLTFGYDNAVAEVGDAIRAAGYMPSVTLTSNAGESCLWLARGWRVLVRPWYVVGLGDDPDLTLPPEASARARVQALEWYVPLLCPGHDEVTVQLTNETTWPSAEYLNRWIVAACDECTRRGWTCAPVMFSVGTPELDWMPALRPALAALAEGQHALGYNAYGYGRDVMLCDLTAAYTVWRVRLLRIAAGDAPWPRVVASEAARGAGDAPPIVSDAACFVRQAAGVYDDVMLWYSGGPSAWSGGRWYADAIRALVSIL